MRKTWFITGCSEGGLGAAIARCALEAGNNVVVTARNTEKVAGIIRDFPDTAWKRYPENALDQRDQPGDPQKAGEILLQVMQSGKLPFRLLLGRQAVGIVRQEYRERMEEIEAWKHISETADFE